jgi:hypothetical protein
MSYKLNPFTNNFDYYDAGTGSTVSQDLNSVLTTGNNAGSNDIDMNNKDLLNVDNIDLNTINGAAYPPSISGTTAGGDLSGIYPNPKVDGLQGYAVSNVAPISGQTLQWSGSEWTPKSVSTGGSGGGGIFYYFNYQNIANISPTTGLPTSPVAPSQLGITYSVGSGSITSANLSQGSYSLVCGFVTIAGTPSVTNIPAGLWDFNIWVDILGGTGNANQTQFQIRVYKYDGSTAPSLLASSDDIYIYDPTTIAQYIANVTMPQTTILSTDRIYIELWAKKNVNQSRQIRFYFDSLHPSHVHTTLPSVAGSGIAKVVNGVFQSPASNVIESEITLSDNTTNDVSTSKHGFVPKAPATNGAYLEVSGTSAVWRGIVYTIELIDALTVDFYAPYDLKINSISNVLNSPSVTLQDDGAAYTLTNTISIGSKITVAVNTAAVINLNITKV